MSTLIPKFEQVGVTNVNVAAEPEPEVPLTAFVCA